MAAYFLSMGMFLLVNAPCTPTEVAENAVMSRGDSFSIAMAQEDPRDPASQPPRRPSRRDAPPRHRGDRDLIPPLNSPPPAESRPQLNLPQIREAPRRVQHSDRATIVMRLGYASAIDTAKTLTEWLATEEGTNGSMASVVPVAVSNILLVTGSKGQLEKIGQIVKQLDRPVPQVRIKAVLVKIAPKDSPDNDVAKTATLPKGSIEEVLAALKHRGSMRVIARLELLALDNIPAMLQLGGRIPRVTGTARSAGGRVNSVSLENVGTLIQATCRVLDNDRITLQIELESSEMGPKEEGVVIADMQDEGPVRTPVTETVTFQTTASVSSGEALILGGMAYGSGERRGDVLLVLQADILK